jgi:hypothetical protein
MAKTTIMLKADTKQRAASKVTAPTPPTAEELEDRYSAACDVVLAAILAMAPPNMKPKMRKMLIAAVSEQFEHLDSIVSDLVCMGPDYA